MIKLIIFDLDGTLVNAYPAVSQSVNHTLKALGLLPRSYLQIKRSVGHGDRQLMEHFVGKAKTGEAIAIYRRHHAKALAARGGVRFLPGALTTLKFLKTKGYKLAVASNRPDKFTRIILKKLEVLKLFDLVLCADKAEKPKPYPQILWAIARRLKADRDEVLYVGDMTIDINCGHKAGIRVVAVATGSSTKKELKDLKPWRIIGKIIEIKRLLAPSMQD